jgi:secreted PhoX family phosphatase
MADKINHGEGCSCGCQDGADENMNITLEFDDGEKVEVEPLFIFSIDNKDYIALVPVDEESDDVYLYIYHELGDEEFEFLDIEDDAEFDRVSAEFERIIEETEGVEE